MDLKNTVSAARLLYDCMVRGKTDFGQIAYTPSKTRLLSPAKESFFPKASPRRAGVDGNRLNDFIRAVSHNGKEDLHSLIVLSGGKCVFEAAKDGYDTAMPHATFSLCKTLTGLAIGMLVSDGKLTLSDTAISFFPEYKGKLFQSKAKALRISHLLEMSTSIVFNEAGAVTEESFTKSYFTSSTKATPGSVFAYNSMNSYILSAIVGRVSGKPLCEFLHERLFAPMDITNYFWEKSAEGIEKGGWGLYLSPRSMAKIGQLFLQRGVWDGKQLVSAAWISEMTAKHMAVPDEVGEFDYGYHIWRHKKDGSLLLNGMLGQNVWVAPDRDLVVAFTAGDNCMFQDAEALVCAMRSFRKKMRGRDSCRAKRERRLLKKRFGESASYTPPHPSEEARDAEKRLLPSLLHRFALSKNNSGLLPLITMLTQNLPVKGVNALAITRGSKKDTLILSLTEEDVTYRIPMGNCAFLPTALSVRGERYRVCAAYSFGKDELRRPFFKVEIRFPALASTRRFLFRETGEGLILTFSENPGYTFVEKLVSIFPGAGAEKEAERVFSAFTKMPLAWILKRVKATLSPTVRLTEESEQQKSSPKKPEISQ